MYRKTMAFGPQGHRHGRDQRRRHRALGRPRQGRRPAGLPPARRPDQAAHSRLRQPPVQHAARRARGRGAPLQGRRLPRDEAALRLGAGRRRRRACSATSIWCAPCAKRSATASTSWPTPTWAGRSTTRKRMLPLLEPFNLRWLEEAVIPDDLQGYAALKALRPRPDRRRRARLHAARVPRPARGARARLHPVRHQPRRRHHAGAQDRGAGRGATQVPVVPHAGQMHNYHVVMASLNSPMAEYFPHRRRRGRQRAVLVHLRRRAEGRRRRTSISTTRRPGLGLTINEAKLAEFQVTE